MGLFGKFINKLNEMRQDAKEVVDEIIDDVKNADIEEAVKNVAAVVIATPFYIADKFGIINFDIDNTATADEIGMTYSLTDNSSPEQVQKIVSLLRERVEVYRANGKILENAAKDDIDKFFEELTEDFKKNDEVAQLINFDLIEEEHKNLLKKIDGAYSEVYEKKLSIDNDNCRMILAMDKGKDKKAAMLKFTEDLKKKAIENFSDTFGNTVTQQEKEICKALDNYFDAKASEFAEQKKQFENWERDKQKQNFDEEKAQLPALEKLYVIEKIENILAA